MRRQGDGETAKGWGLNDKRFLIEEIGFASVSLTLSKGWESFKSEDGERLAV